MKNISYILLTLLFLSCQNRQENKMGHNIEDIPTIRTEDTLSFYTASTLLDNGEEIDLMKVPRLTRFEYYKMQLNKVPELKGYNTNYLSKGKTLSDNENGKLITVSIISDGEITEFLLSYDKDGKLIDNMIVAYEDMVEYYSQKSYNITVDIITLREVKFSYMDIKGSYYETSDTTYVSYKISPDLRFIKE
ncbi:MAG: hypothetical protein LBV43_02110 [Prevotella sp.]|jgi:hypothetical protein|nr:hypothetical protein [Prevotella sp.]